MNNKYASLTTRISFRLLSCLNKTEMKVSHSVQLWFETNENKLNRDGTVVACCFLHTAMTQFHGCNFYRILLVLSFRCSQMPQLICRYYTFSLRAERSVMHKPFLKGLHFMCASRALQSTKYPKQVKLSSGAEAKGNTIIPIFLFILANWQVDMVWFTEEHDLRWVS